MSTLRITPRAATLATGHSVGAGQVNVPHHHIAHLSAGADETVKWRGVSDAGRGISDFGNAMLKISAVLADERNEMQLNEFEADFNARVTQAELDKDNGFLTRRLANTGDLEKLATEGPREVKDIFDEVAEAHGMTGVKRSWAENRVRGRVSSVGKRIADRVATTHQALKVQAATRTTATLQDAWRINRDDDESTHALIDAFRAQQYAAGASDDQAELAVGQFVNALAEEYAADKYGKLATAEQVDAAEKQLEEDPAAILSGNAEFAKAFADVKSPPFDPAAAKRLKGVLSARRHEIEAAIHEREAAERRARQAVVRDFTYRELSMRDKDQECWADEYAAMGRDEKLREADPRRAMAYMDAANEMRAAASKAKEKASADAIKGNEDGLKAALNQLQILELEGSISQDDANDAQAAIWRKFRTCALCRTVSPGFMRSFRDSMEKRLTDQEANAMRKFYGLLGFHGEITGNGEVTAAAKRDAESAYKTADGLEFDDVEMFDMGEEILRRLHGMGPAIDRQGAVDEVVKDVFSRALSRKMDAEDVRDAIVSGLGEYEDRFEAKRQNGGKDGDGKDGE